MTVKKLLYLLITVLALALIFTTITSNVNNRFTHDCVPNRDQQAFDTFNKILGPDPHEPDQKQWYCQPNHHPRLTEKWETINRYTLYTAYAITIPTILCCLVILNDRRVRRRINHQR